MPRSAAIIGGGPAGTSAALGLLRAGFDVDLYEQRERWTGCVCGAFLNSEAVRQLHWLDVIHQIEKRKPAVVRSTQLFDDRGRHMEVPSEGLALPRKDLEEVLLDSVREHGGRIHFGARITLLSTLPADMVVVACGRGRGQGNWYGWKATFKGVPKNPGDLSLHFYPGGYVGTLMFADGTTNVCGLFKRTGKTPLVWEEQFAYATQTSASLKNYLGHAKRISDWMGVGPLPFTTSMKKGRGLFLAGDAAAVGDPYMGEGLGRALSAGPMLFEAIHHENSHAAYEKLWQNHYVSRLRFGKGSRLLLGSKIFFHPGMRLIFRARATLLQALPIFHGGFHGPNISYSQL